jgi:hypothetical protein
MVSGRLGGVSWGPKIGGNRNSMDEETRARLVDLESRIKAVERLLKSPSNPAGQKPVSISEFLRSTKPSSDVEKTLAIVYYLEKFEQKDSINSREILDAFIRAKEPAPVNVNESVNKNIRKGFLMEVPARKESRKAWVVTNSGEVRVAELYRKT